MLLAILASTAGAARRLPTTGLAALSTLAVVPTVIWGLASGSVAAWFGHRYASGNDDDGYEIAVLADATCPRCEHVITLAESAPGRTSACASCRKRLPFTWIGTQLAVLVGSLAMLTTFGQRAVLVPFLWLVPVVVTAAVTDLRTMLIPKRVVWVGLGVGFASIAAVAVWLGIPGSLPSAIVGSLAYFGLMFVFHVISPGGMGFGDVRLALVLGLYLGWLDWRLPLFGLLLGNLAYLVYAVPQRIANGRDGDKFSPFGPGLAMGTLLAVCFYTSLI